MLDPISVTYLLAIGILLIALEVITFSFVLFWFGIGFIVVAILSYFNIYDDGLWQIASATIIALLLLYFLRTKALKRFLKSKDKEHNDNFLNEVGEGVIKNAKVYYKATYWDIDSKDSFDEDEKVKVLSAKKGKAKVEKI